MTPLNRVVPLAAWTRASLDGQFDKPRETKASCKGSLTVPRCSRWAQYCGSRTRPAPRIRYIVQDFSTDTILTGSASNSRKEEGTTVSLGTILTPYTTRNQRAPSTIGQRDASARQQGLPKVIPTEQTLEARPENVVSKVLTELNRLVE